MAIWCVHTCWRVSVCVWAEGVFDAYVTVNMNGQRRPGRNAATMLELSEEEAGDLIQELKDSVISEFDMPEGKQRGKGFEVIGKESESEYRIDLYRGIIDYDKHSVNARLMKGGVVLMRLCVGGHPHTNPDGTVIAGTHLHIYKAGHGARFAYPMDISSPDFINDTILLLNRFNVVKKPHFNDGMLP